MKIGIFIPRMTPEVGGGFTFAETVTGRLENKTDELHLFFYGNAPLEPSPGLIYHSLGGQFRRLAGNIFYNILGSAIRISSFKLGRLLGSKLFLPLIRFPASLLDAQIRKQKIDLVWFPTPLFEPVEAPYIATVWDLEHRAQPYFPEVSSDGEWDGREKYFRKMLTRASYIVTGTRIGKEEIQNFYGVSPDRIRLLPHPTPPFALVESAKEVKISVSKPYVFYPAQFWAHKNHVVLLQMMAELKKRGHSLQCVFVGSDKGNKSHIAELARKWQVKDQVKFLGFVSRDELVALYKSALATVYPSLCGPENLPPLEAMALGSPVIATSIKGALEQLNDAAILVSGQDPSAWADAVEKLLHDEELRKEMIKRGRTRAQRYTQKEFSDDLFKIFDEFRKIRSLWGSHA